MMDQREQRVVRKDRHVSMELKQSEQKEVSRDKWSFGFKWIVGGVLVIFVLGWWWWVERRG